MTWIYLSEGIKQNGRLSSSSSSKSGTQESENHKNRLGSSETEMDDVATSGGNDVQKPRSPSSIPSPEMMRSKRAVRQDHTKFFFSLGFSCHSESLV